MAETFGYEYCTHVQAQSLPACLAGGDVLAKAKTGTGKTIGFLIPVIERVSGHAAALAPSPALLLTLMARYTAACPCEHGQVIWVVVIASTWSMPSPLP